MPDRLTCPICRDALMVEADRELELHACPTCCFRAPLHIVHLVGAERAELARLRGSETPGAAAEVRALNRHLKDLAFELLERAHSAERMSAGADDDFDLAHRDHFRGRALGFRCAMRLVEQLVGVEQPKRWKRGDVVCARCPHLPHYSPVGSTCKVAGCGCTCELARTVAADG